MASTKCLYFSLVFLALLAVTSSSSSEDKAAAAPVVHIISKVAIPIELNIGDGSLSPVIKVELRPGQDYQIKVLKKKNKYGVLAYYGRQYASFDVYRPARDVGRDAIFWRADDGGVFISYDNVKFKKVAPWDFE